MNTEEAVSREEEIAVGVSEEVGSASRTGWEALPSVADELDVASTATWNNLHNSSRRQKLRSPYSLWYSMTRVYIIENISTPESSVIWGTKAHSLGCINAYLVEVNLHTEYNHKYEVQSGKQLHQKKLAHLLRLYILMDDRLGGGGDSDLIDNTSHGPRTSRSLHKRKTCMRVQQ